MLTPVNDAMSRSRHGDDVGRAAAPATCSAAPPAPPPAPSRDPRRLNATEALSLAPSLRADTLRGGLLAWDGQLEDDARLVVTVARTAASYGAHVRTRARVTSATGTGVELRDELTGATYAVRARAVVNATGVWAGDLDDQVRLRPSRGTHLVLRGSALPHTRVAVMVPIPGPSSRFAMVLPQPDGTLYVGLTDEPVTGPVPGRADAERGRDRLPARRGRHRVHRTADARRRGRRLRRPAAAARGRRARTRPPTCRAATPSSPRATGVTTVVGGKLTTYRRMAEDTLDALVAAGRLSAGPVPHRGAPPPRRRPRRTS